MAMADEVEDSNVVKTTTFRLWCGFFSSLPVGLGSNSIE
jgi:hypothetical protein